MRLMRWLAVGCSLGKIRDDRNRYKMAEQGLLPRFGPVANSRSPAGAAGPVNETAHPVKKIGARKGTGTVGAGANERNSMTTAAAAMDSEAALPRHGDVDADDASIPREGESVTLLKQEEAPTADTDAADTAEGVVQKEMQPADTGQRFPLGRWTMFRNPFSRASKTATSPRAPVQAELMLDLVKPVRNDLTESDVVVVSGAAAAPAAPAVAVTPRVQESGPDTAEVTRPRILPEAEVQAQAQVPVQVGTEAEPVWSRLKTQFFGAEKG